MIEVALPDLSDDWWTLPRRIEAFIVGSAAIWATTIAYRLAIKSEQRDQDKQDDQLQN